MGVTLESRGSSTPASKATIKNMRNAMDGLPSERTELFRKAAGSALSIATDSARDHVWHVRACCNALVEASPLGPVHGAIPRGTLDCEYQRTQEMPAILRGTDWAADTEAWKSVSCTIERLGGHLLGCSVAKQTVVALSSGESESHGIVRTAAFGIQTRQLLCQLGVPLRLDILCEISGSGMVRHLSMKKVWLQEALRKSDFSLRVVVRS